MRFLTRLRNRARPRARPAPELQALKRAVQGSTADLAQFYEQHVDRLYAFVFYRVGRDASLAEDVVQDTFLRALDHLDRYDAARGSLQAWLRSLSRNAIRDGLRAHGRGEELAMRWEQIDQTLGQLFKALDQAPLSDEVIGRTETRELVNMTIANLPDHYGAVLQHKYVDGESIEALAARLALSQAATKSLLSRAREAFRQTFSALSQSMAEVK